MLIQKQIITVKWHSFTKKYYIEKGYKFTKIGEKFKVNIDDLPLGSDLLIEFICDYCNSISIIKYDKYNRKRQKSKIKKDCCSKTECSNEKKKEVMRLTNPNYGIAKKEPKKIKRKVNTSTKQLRIKKSNIRLTKNKKYAERSKVIDLEINNIKYKAKKCVFCNQIKKLEEYHRDKNGSGGRKRKCKECINTGLSDNRKQRTKSNIIENILKLNKEYGKLNTSFIQEHFPALMSSALKKFGSWKLAVEESGLNYDSFRVYKERTIWTESEVLKEIKKLSNLTLSYIYTKNSPLLSAAKKYFGSWGNAVKASGINYDEFIYDGRNLIKGGVMFESLVNDLLNELCLSYEKGFNFELRPDYVFNKYVWGDAKLSEWTVFEPGCDTINKYEPYVKLLTIIYLRGNQERDEMISDKTRLVSVHKFVKQLPKHKQVFYQKEFSRINQILNKSENRDSPTDCLEENLIV